MYIFHFMLSLITYYSGEKQTYLPACRCACLSSIHMMLNKIEDRLRESIEKGLFKTFSKKIGWVWVYRPKLSCTFIYVWHIWPMAMHIFVLKRHLNMLDFFIFILDQ